MPVTSPDSIYFSDTTTTMDPNAISAAQATSVQAALALRQRYEFVWTNATGRTSQTGMVNSSTGYQIDTKAEYIYESSAWRLKTPHAEFTSSGSIGNATLGTVGTLSLDATNSSSNSFITSTGAANGGFIITDPGIYLISGLIQYTTANMTGRSFIDVAGNPTTDSPILDRRSIPTGEAVGVSGAVNTRTTAAGTAFYFVIFQTSGVSNSFGFRARITRLG